MNSTRARRNRLARGDLRAQGPYLEVSRFVARGDFWRASLGGRGELLVTKHATGTGLHARMDAELFKQDGAEETHDNRCGTSYAVWGDAVGFGVYAEAGAQLLPGGERALREGNCDRGHGHCQVERRYETPETAV